MQKNKLQSYEKGWPSSRSSKHIYSMDMFSLYHKLKTLQALGLWPITPYSKEILISGVLYSRFTKTVRNYDAPGTCTGNSKISFS